MVFTAGLELAQRFVETANEVDAGDPAAVAAARAGRDEAIALLTGDLRRLSHDDAGMAAMLGELRFRRYLDPWPEPPEPDRADLDAARDLLLGAAGQDPDEGEVYLLTLVLDTRMELDPRPADRDAFIIWAGWLLDRAPGGPPDEEVTDLRHGLASALLDRAESGAPSKMADLDAAIEQLQVMLTAVGDELRTVVLVALVRACWLRLDGDAGDYALVDRMVGYGRQAWPLLEREDEDRPLCGLFLATGIQEQMVRPGARYDAGAVDLGIDVLTEVTPRFNDDGDLYLLAESALGLFLVARGEQAGSAADLAAAVPFVTHTAAALPSGDPTWAQITQTVATSVTILVSNGMLAGPEHADLTIGLLRAALAEPVPDPERVAMTRMVLGVMLVARGFERPGGDIGEGIAELVAAHGMAPAGSDVRALTAWNLGSMLLTRYNRAGDRQDLQAARFYLGMVEDAELAWHPGVLSGLAADHAPVAAAVRGVAAVASALDGDTAAFSVAVDSFRRALKLLPSGHPKRARIRSDLGLALVLRGAHGTGGADDLREGMRELDAAVATLPSGSFVHALTRMRAGTALAARGVAEHDARTTREAIGYLVGVHGDLDPESGGYARMTAQIGLLYAELYGLTRRGADLEAARSWLERACGEFERQPGDPMHAAMLTRLARLRRPVAGGGAGAVQAGLAALRVRVRDVLLQTGTVNALAAARAAAADAAEFATWCLDDSDPGRAAEALELGRGLVLHAATSVAGLPELLTAAGRPDLAREWRAYPAQGGEPWAGQVNAEGYFSALLSGDPLVAPSDLRERTLAALGESVAGLLTTPSPAEIAVALGRNGFDALVYLLPAPRGPRALLIAADGSAPREVALPGAPAAPLDEYAAAHADLLAGADHFEVVDRWRKALEALCSWTWPAAIGPLLTVLAATSPRIVLVPVGRLSLVPWHAARHRDPAGFRYACADAVFSYAASGRQLAEVSDRAVLPWPAWPVIVADPTGELPYAVREAEAIRECFYPGARYLGTASPAGQGADGRGEPDEVLAAMPSATEPGASVFHLALHAGLTPGAPDRSFLQLADRKPLTLDRILTQAARRPPGAAGGLVSLIACRSDLAATDYDEALTLATAFLAAGAVTVVGARWEIRDEHTSVLMYMFHHFLLRADLRPADALRSAQLWMLDPDRHVPEQMPEALKARVSSRLAGVIFWAGFTHQGR